MTHTFKAGDKAVVTIVSGPDNDGDYRICGGIALNYSFNTYVGKNSLPPIPPSITPEAQAVLDAALAWEHATNTSGCAFWQPLTDATKAYRKSITQPDPIAELIETAKNYIQGKCAISHLEDAIGAAEASRK